MIEEYFPPKSRPITQADVDEAVARINERRRAGINAPGNHLYNLNKIADAIEQENENIKTFEEEIEKSEGRRRDLKKLYREQEDIQRRLEAGEYVEGYSAPRE